MNDDIVIAGEQRFKLAVQIAPGAPSRLIPEPIETLDFESMDRGKLVDLCSETTLLAGDDRRQGGEECEYKHMRDPYPR